MARAADRLDQAVAMQHRVDGGLGRDADVVVQASNQ
jgi:hypothetical protein